MILVTGGLGYIGSHTCVALLREGHALTIVDSLANSKIAVLERIRSLGGGSVATCAAIPGPGKAQILKAIQTDF